MQQPRAYRADPYYRLRVAMQQPEGAEELRAQTEPVPGITPATVLAQLCGARVQQPKNDAKKWAVSAWLTSLTAAVDTEHWHGPV